MPSVKDQLSEDHEEHERLLLRLAESVTAGDPPAMLQGRWLQFEHTVIEHLEAEEQSLFGVFVQTHRREIDELRAEHRAIRYAVIGLSVCVALHTVEKAAVDELLTLLRNHSAHEDRTLHKWLAQDEGISSLRAVLAMRSRLERVKEEPVHPASSAGRAVESSPRADGARLKKRVC